MIERSATIGARKEGSPPWVVLNLDDVGTQVSGVLVTGTVVLLLSGSRDREWATRAALKLSETWAGSGRRIVLADLHLEEPMIEAQPAGPALEGIVDIFLYGASISRIAALSADGSYYVIPAGTYAPDAEEIFRHPRWSKLVAGFRDTQATLLIFAPVESQGLGELAAWAPEAVILGSAAESAVVRELADRGVTMRAAINPQPGGGAPPAEPVVEDVPTEPEIEAGDAPEVPSAEAEPELPPPPSRRKADELTPYVLLIVLLIVVMIGAIVYVLAALRPDLIPPADGRPAQEQAEGGGGATRSASRTGSILNYSINVKAFPSLLAAREQLPLEERRFPSTVFFISPEEIQGVVYYKIMAGLASDTISATRLRDRLVRDGSIETEDVVGTWSLLQETPMAFDLGEFDTIAEARTRAEALLLLGIPTYLVAIPYADGTQTWQLYAGAYRDSFHAARMESLLTDAGISAPFTLRAGTPVTVAE